MKDWQFSMIALANIPLFFLVLSFFQLDRVYVDRTAALAIAIPISASGFLLYLRAMILTKRAVERYGIGIESNAVAAFFIERDMSFMMPVLMIFALGVLLYAAFSGSGEMIPVGRASIIEPLLALMLLDWLNDESTARKLANGK